MSTAGATVSFPALGTTAVVGVADPGKLVRATDLTRWAVDRLDLAASRFRPDSELASLHAAGGRPVAVSPELWTAVVDALDAARATGGLVDPTVGAAVAAAGYDRDFASVAPSGPAAAGPPPAVPGWRTVRLDRRRRTVAVPAHVRLDLGATAKAGCADRAAAAAAAATGCGVLVSLGGDVATAGPPPRGGWTVRIADTHDAGPDDPTVTVGVHGGGLATSGTAARRWVRGGDLRHHVVDPATGCPAATCWRTVTVAAGSCLAANTAATAAVVLGPGAPAWLGRRGVHARLVAEDGTVAGTGAWPADRLVPES